MSELQPITVARLIPENDYAKKAFDEIAISDTTLDDHKVYLKYESIVSTPGKLNRSEAPHDTLYDLGKLYPNDESTDNESDAKTDLPGQFGYFRLDFSHMGKHPMGWRMGRGSDVDVLVVSHRKPAMGVANTHALIRFHQQSGILMLTGVSQRHPVIYFLNNEPLELYSGESHVLFQQSNRFQLGKLEFILKYDSLNEREYLNWVGARDALMQLNDHQPASPHILGLPYLKPFIKLGDFIFHENLGYGGFGFVKAAVHSRTGSPVAVKELTIKNQHNQREYEHEIRISKALEVTIYLLYQICDLHLL